MHHPMRGSREEVGGPDHPPHPIKNENLLNLLNLHIKIIENMPWANTIILRIHCP